MESAILRQALLIDFEVGQNFNPGDDGRVHGFRQDQRAMQHAVNPVAHPQVFFGRLNVDIGSAGLDSMPDDDVHDF